MLHLTEKELHDFTGYRRPSKQIKWLKDYGIRHFIAADGHPRVLLSDLGVSQKQQVSEPDLQAVRSLSKV
jgi:hypothetical protein